MPDNFRHCFLQCLLASLCTRRKHVAPKVFCNITRGLLHYIWKLMKLINAPDPLRVDNLFMSSVINHGDKSFILQTLFLYYVRDWYQGSKFGNKQSVFLRISPSIEQNRHISSKLSPCHEYVNSIVVAN